MNPRIAAAAAAACAALVMAAGAGAEPGDPHANGCPSGFEALSVSELAPYGYRVPGLLDSPANGGNGDGIVCGKPWTAAEQAARLPDETVQIYDFEDNFLPPFGR